MPSAAETAPVVQRIDPYDEWRQEEGVPLVGGIYIKDMKSVEVGPWPRKGVKGALCYMDGDDEQDEHIVEIPPGDSPSPGLTWTTRRSKSSSAGARPASGSA